MEGQATKDSRLKVRRQKGRQNNVDCTSPPKMRLQVDRSTSATLLFERCLRARALARARGRPTAARLAAAERMWDVCLPAVECLLAWLSFRLSFTLALPIHPSVSNLVIPLISWGAIAHSRTARGRSRGSA
eukprot:1344025-Pyramimonas_sp.AAC.1